MRLPSFKGLVPDRLLDKWRFWWIIDETKGRKATTMTSLSTLATVVARATPATKEDQAQLKEAAELLTGDRLLASATWLGYLGFPHQLRSTTGLRRATFQARLELSVVSARFPLADVLAVKDDIRQTRAENASGHLEIGDYGDEDPYAGR